MKFVLIWDWDGTIADSNSWKLGGGAWEMVFKNEPLLIKLVHNILNDDVGRSLTRYEIIEETLFYAKEKNIVSKYKPEIYADKFSDAVKKGYSSTGLFSGANDVLEILYEKGYKMHVISASAQKDLVYAANEHGISKYFVSINGLPGTKVENFEKIKKINNKSEDRYVVIGDGISDKKLSEHIGCSFIAVVNEWNNWADNDSIINRISNIKEVPKIIDSL